MSLNVSAIPLGGLFDHAVDPTPLPDPPKRRSKPRASKAAALAAATSAGSPSAPLLRSERAIEEDRRLAAQTPADKAMWADIMAKMADEPFDDNNRGIR